MNRYFSLLVAVLLSTLSFSLVSCGDDDDDDTDGGKGSLVVNGSKVSFSDAEYEFTRTTTDWSDDEYVWYCTFSSEIRIDDLYTLEMTQYAKTQKDDDGSWMSGYRDVQKLGWLNVGQELNPDVYFEYGFHVSGQTVEIIDGSIVTKSKSAGSITLEFKNFKFDKDDVIYTLNGDMTFKQSEQVWD